MDYGTAVNFKDEDFHNSDNNFPSAPLSHKWWLRKAAHLIGETIVLRVPDASDSAQNLSQPENLISDSMGALSSRQSSVVRVAKL